MSIKTIRSTKGISKKSSMGNTAGTDGRKRTTRRIRDEMTALNIRCTAFSALIR